MNHRLAFPLALLILAALLGACGGGNQSQYCDPANLQAPILTYPFDGGQYVVYQTLMTWAYNDPACQPEGYHIEVDTVSDFSGSVLGATSTLPNSTGWPLPVQDGVTYFWRVRAFVGSTEGPWSTVKSFNGVLPCDLTALVAPEANFPSQGSSFAWAEPNFNWTYPDPACAPEAYHLQLAFEPTYAATVLDIQIPDPTMHWESPAAVTTCAIYYWRVAGTAGGVDGPFSDPVSFRVDPDFQCPSLACEPTGLIPPDSLNPSNYEIVSSLTPTLEWDYPFYCDPAGFVIRLSTEHDLAGQTLQGGLGLSDSWLAGPLEPATRYWWDVAAIEPPALGNFSGQETFFTGPECTSPGDILGPVELVSPPDGAELDDTTAWLQVNAGPSVGCIPDGWALDLQTDPSFGGQNLLTTYMYPGTIVITDPLQDCTQYFWRAAAVEGGLAGAWSEPRSFFTNAAGNCALSMVPEIPFVGALRDLACYMGPNPQTYPIEGYLLAGETSPVFGQNIPGTWWAIRNPDNPGDTCYVPKDGVEPGGDVSGIARWNDPQLPTPIPACNSFNSLEACEAAGCYWYATGVTAAVYGCHSNPP